jgi:hypothetical protein
MSYRVQALMIAVIAQLVMPTFAVAQETVNPSAAPRAPEQAATVPASATVIFFRPSSFTGAIIPWIVTDEVNKPKRVGRLHNGTYCTIQVPPGKHLFNVLGARLSMDANAGETYYFVTIIRGGYPSGSITISLSDKATFDAQRAKLKELPAG